MNLTTILRAGGLLIVALLLAWPLAQPVQAEVRAGGDAKASAPAGKIADAGHAEKDPAGFIDLPKRWDLSIYTILVFAILFGLLYFLAWPNISEGLKKREEMIEAVKTAAEKAKSEAEEVRAKLAAELATANDKVRLMLEEARRDADALRAKERELGAKEAAEERARAKREIAAEKDAALQEVYQKAVDLATILSTKAVQKNLNADDHKHLIDEAIGELSKK